jgi:hypothetical protein
MFRESRLPRQQLLQGLPGDDHELRVLLDPSGLGMGGVPQDGQLAEVVTRPDPGHLPVVLQYPHGTGEDDVEPFGVLAGLEHRGAGRPEQVGRASHGIEDDAVVEVGELGHPAEGPHQAVANGVGHGLPGYSLW